MDGDDLVRNIQSPPSDRDPTANSDFSAVTIDQSTKWTDHLHHLYLNSLEASFVNELHRSIQSLGRNLRNDSKEASKSKTLQNSQNMTKQFPAIQDCRWKKICVERNEPMLESTADSHVLAGCPSRVAPVARGCVMRESDVYDGGMLCDQGTRVRGVSKFSRRSPRIIEKSCHQESVDCPAEATDQNFKNDDEGASSSCMPVSKRLKTAIAETSSNEQVVPSGNFLRTDVSSNMKSSSENEGQHELLSELPESFYGLNSNRHSFLRGS